MWNLSDESINKIAKRLACLWHIRDADPEFYMKFKLGHEKEEIYSCFGGNSEIFARAQEYSQEVKKYRPEELLKEGYSYEFDFENFVECH